MSDPAAVPGVEPVPAPRNARLSEDGVEPMREAVTMALYQSLSMLAVLLATPTPNPADDTRLLVSLTVVLTGLGLLAAHHVAFRISSRLVNAGVLTDESLRLLRAQALGGLPVIVLAALPPLIFGVEFGTVVSELLLLFLVALVGYRAVRQAVSRRRSFVYLLGTVLIASAVITLKLAVGH